jgi:hypothetical protein
VEEGKKDAAMLESTEAEILPFYIFWHNAE